MDILEYDIDFVLNLLKSEKAIGNITTEEFNIKNIPKGFSLVSIAMISFYMAGKNSPFPYNDRGNNMASMYIRNLYYREKGNDIDDNTVENIVSIYGDSGFRSLGRCTRNLADLMGPLKVKINIVDENTIRIINSYTKIFNRDKILNRMVTVVNHDGNLTIVDGKGAISMPAFGTL